MQLVSKHFIIGLLFFIPIASPAQQLKQQAITEIIQAEKNFAAMAAEKGIEAAFTFFAAKDAVIKRGNDSLIFGRAAISNFYSDVLYTKVVLKWSPDFTDASESGDLGYTFGKYTLQLKDKDGKIIQESTGVFHSVWKKQPDGSWKFVWD
jgi:ketosteroid isomerase-like protein